LRVYVAIRPADFRKGMDGLALVVQERFGLDPFSGAAFVFRAKRADRIKIVGTAPVWYWSTRGSTGRSSSGRRCRTG